MCSLTRIVKTRRGDKLVQIIVFRQFVELSSGEDKKQLIVLLILCARKDYVNVYKQMV